jgi:hypothetical protein
MSEHSQIDELMQKNWALYYFWGRIEGLAKYYKSGGDRKKLIEDLEKAMEYLSGEIKEIEGGKK